MRRKMKLQVNPSPDWHVTGQGKRKDGWDEKGGWEGGIERGKRRGVIERWWARRFPEPAAELNRLGACRSGELRRGVSGSGKVFYGSPLGLQHALVRHGHCLRSDPKPGEQRSVCVCECVRPLTLFSRV